MIDAAVVREALETAERASVRARIVIRPLTTTDDLTRVSGLFDEVWGVRNGEASEMQPPLLRALEHSGSYVVGAFHGDEMVAASVAFLAAPIGRGLHSHITGVRPGRSGSGTGAALKWHQRAWALERGIDTVTWTYDPLVARNSFFNIARLGASPREYLVDFYGLMSDGLNAGQPSDRVMAVWELTSPPVVKAAAGGRGAPVGNASVGNASVGSGTVGSAASGPEEILRSGAHALLTADPLGEPVVQRGDADVILLAVPPDIEALRTADSSAALRWRLALRETLGPMIGDHRWAVTDFLRPGWYVLGRSDRPEKGDS